MVLLVHCAISTVPCLHAGLLVLCEVTDDLSQIPDAKGRQCIVQGHFLLAASQAQGYLFEDLLNFLL